LAISREGQEAMSAGGTVLDLRAKCLILFKTFFSLLGFSAIVTAIATLVERGTFDPVNFFSFFTVLSNLLAIVTLLASALLYRRSADGGGLAMLRGAATLYMAMTGIVYIVLLSALDSERFSAVPWENITLHYVMPAVMVVDWAVDRPSMPISFRRALLWLAFPIVYVVYSLVRGSLVGWYPYPFLDPAISGYVGVAVTSLGILVLALVLSFVLTWISRWRSSPARMAS
jgi:hypothetical protein